MQRRDFLKMLPLAAVAPETKAETTKRWTTYVCPSGTHEGECIDAARKKATELNYEVRFTFNYHRHYSVMPDGTYECQDDALT